MLPYPDIDPVALHFGPLQIRWYGLSYVVGILLAWWLLRYRALKQPLLGWTTVQVGDLIFYAALGMIIGGRLGSVLFYNLPYYAAHPLEIFMLNRGGMSFHGGLLGVLVALWFYSRTINQTYGETLDFLSPVVPVGLFFGRIANFINGELWGAPSNLPWAVIFPDPRTGGIPRHPSQLYEALLEGVVLFIILWLFSEKIRPKLAVTGLSLLCYGIFRCAVEFVREPDANIGYLAFGWLTMGQVLSVPMVVAGIVLLWLAYSKRREA